MTVPFHPRPGDPDADHLNTLLDAMRSGTRAPDAASPDASEAAALANAAGQLRGLVRRADAPAAAYIERHPLQNRWEDIVSIATAIPAAPPSAMGEEGISLPRPVSNRTRRASASPQPPAGNRLNAWLSAAIVAFMLLGTIGGAWWLGPGGNGSNDDLTRLAAVTQEDESTPAAGSDFLRYIDPLECQATAPMGIGAYRDLVAEDRDIPEPHYGPVTQPAERDAVDAARTAREAEACKYLGPEVPFLKTESLMWREGNFGPYGYPSERTDRRTDNARAVSEILADVTPGDLWIRGDRQPALSVGQPFQVFLPEHAVQFEDGRIGIPASFLIPEDDATWTDSPPDWLFVWFSVLSNESGEWLLDDELHVCVGGCDEFIAGGPVVFPYYRVFDGTPVSTPDATTAGIWPEPLSPEEAPWVAAVSPEECVAEPLPWEEYAEAITTEPGEADRSYEIVGPVAPEDAEAGVATLRGWFACGDAGDITRVRAHFTNSGLFYLGATADNVDTWDEMVNTRREIGMQWSVWAAEEGVYPLAVVRDVDWDFTSSLAGWTPGDPFPGQQDAAVAYSEWRYNPDDAYMLADGRMMIHGTVIYWAADPMVQDLGIAEEPNVIVMAYILEEVDGQWLIDEQNIQMCFNASCDQVRDAMATPVASPAATPVD